MIKINLLLILAIIIKFVSISASAAIITNEQKIAYYFVNHEAEVEELRAKLLKVQKVGITGITGKGKSELARRYVDQYKDKYQIIAFFNADVDLTPQYIELALDINNNICSDKDCLVSTSPKKVKEGIINFLNSQQEWLLIFDNLQVNQNNKIKDIIDWKNKGHVIITTQDTINIPNRVEVPYLKDFDAKLLIKNIAPNTTDGVIEKIVAKCKGYPYLVSHISTFIANYKHKNIDEVINYIEKHDNPIVGFTEMILSTLTPSQQDLLLKIAILNNQGISGKLLHNIFVDNSGKLTDDIHQLARIGVLDQISSDINNQIFQLHDVLRTQLINKFSAEIHRKNIDNTLDAMIKMLPRNSLAQRYEIIAQDKTMISNCEKLLLNSDEYKADFYKCLELRKYVMDYYLCIRDHENCKLMIDWLAKRENSINFKKMNDYQKGIYAYYIAKTGFYEELRNNYRGAITYYLKALDIANTTNDQIARLIPNGQLVQCYVNVGDISSAITVLNNAKHVLQEKHNQIKDDALLYYEAKILFAQGKYEDALKFAQDDIKKENIKLYDKSSASDYMSYLLVAEIYNSIKNYDNAYKLAQEMYGLDKRHLADRSAIEAKILTQLARAELGIDKKQDAKKHINQALELLTAEGLDINTCMDRVVASAFAVEGEILTALTQIKESINCYNKAENIYYNLYRQNMGNVVEVADLLVKGAKAAALIHDKEWYQKFTSNLIKYFGIDSPKVKEVEEFYKTAQGI